MKAPDCTECYVKGDAFPESLPGLDSEIYATICKAISDEKELEIEYIDRSGNRSVRKVRPEALARSGVRWYLMGYCKLRDAFRTFSLYNIESTKLTGKTTPATEYAQQQKAAAARCRAIKYPPKPPIGNVPPEAGIWSSLFSFLTAGLFHVLMIRPRSRIGKDGKPLREPASYQYRKRE